MKKLILISLSIFAFTLGFLPKASLASTNQYGFTWVDRQTITSPSLGTFLLSNVDPAPPTSGGLIGGLTDTGPQTITFKRQNDPDKCTDTFEIYIPNDTVTDWSTGSYTYFPSSPYSAKDSNCHTDHVDVSVADGGNNYNILDWIDSATIRPLPQASGDLYGNTSDFILDPATNEYVQQGSSACHSYIDNVSGSHTGGALHLSLDTNTDIPDKEYFILFQNCYQLKDNVTIKSLITGNSDHTIQNNILAVSFGNPANFATAGTPQAPGPSAPGSTDLCAQAMKSYAWMGCPAYDGSQTFLNSIYTNAIQPLLLDVKPLDVNSPLKKIVDVITSVANVFFIIVFLIMIFGTTLNLSSYTVKKTLPRLIVAAIAIQFSFLICGFIVDTGNVLGGGILDLVSSVLGKSGGQDALWTGLLSGGALAGILTAALLLGPAVLLILLSLVLAIIAFVFTLLIRKIAITMLIIAAPLAIAASVLPNTNQYFKKWYQTFIRIIMVYPVISVILAAGSIAKASIASTGFTGGGIPEIAGAIIGIISFGMMPMAFKWGGSAMGIASKIGSKYSGANAGRSAAWSKGTAPGKEAYKGFKDNRRAVKMEGFNDRFGNPSTGTLKRLRAGARLGNGFGGYTSGGGDRYARAQGSAAAATRNRTESAEQEEKKAAERTLRDLPAQFDTSSGNILPPNEAILDAAQDISASPALQAAAIDKLANLGDTTKLEALKTTMGSTPEGQAHFAKSLAASSAAAKINESAPHLARGPEAYKSMTAEKLSKLNGDGARAMMDHLASQRAVLSSSTASAGAKTTAKQTLDDFVHATSFSEKQRNSVNPEVGRIINADKTIFDPSDVILIEHNINPLSGRFN